LKRIQTFLEKGLYMRLPIKLIIRKGKVRKDGTSLIYVQYCYSTNRRILIGTSVSIPEIYWNKKNCTISPLLPPQYGTADKLVAELREKIRNAEQLIDYALQSAICPISFLKNNFEFKDFTYLEKVGYDYSKLDVFYQIDRYINDKRGLVQPTTLNVFREMKKHLLCFQDYEKKQITFDSFNVGFYERFVKYLTYDAPLIGRTKVTRGLCVNTIGKIVKNLKSFLKDRISRKIIPYIDLSFIKSMEEEVDAVYLNWNELSKIYHLDLSLRPYLIKYRDLFIVGCLTGLRFGDYSDIKPDEIRGDMLYIVQKKTFSSVVIPLREDAKRILIDKYNFVMPKVSWVKFNLYIKEVVRLAGITEPIKISHRKGNETTSEVRPKYGWVSSHTARRSFCTNEYLAGTPTDLIMAISGHKTEKVFRSYIKADKVQKAEMIKKIWADRKGL
jgi:integrase